MKKASKYTKGAFGQSKGQRVSNGTIAVEAVAETVLNPLVEEFEPVAVAPIVADSFAVGKVLGKVASFFSRLF